MNDFVIKHYHLLPDDEYEVYTHTLMAAIRLQQKRLKEHGRYWLLMKCADGPCNLYIPDSSGRLHSEDIRARIDSIRNTRAGVLSREESRHPKRVVSWTSGGWEDDLRLSGG